MKARFRAEGLDSFDQSHVLELLLFYSIPQRDTKPIARRLLDKFGSFDNVLEARYEALLEVEGVGPNTALFLKLINDTGRYYLNCRDNSGMIFKDLNECGNYLVNRFVGIRNEEVHLLCMDAKGRLLACEKIASGTVASVGVLPKVIVETALSVRAASVILAHNHPGGYALPSDSDVVATRNIATILAVVDVYLVDHIIVGDGDFVSLVQSGKYVPTQEESMLR